MALSENSWENLLFMAYLPIMPHMSKDKAGTSRDNEGISRGQQGQAGPGRDKTFCLCLSLSGAACQCLSLLVFLIINAYPNYVPASLFLSLSLPTCVLWFIGIARLRICLFYPFQHLIWKIWKAHYLRNQVIQRLSREETDKTDDKDDTDDSYDTDNTYDKDETDDTEDTNDTDETDDTDDKNYTESIEITEPT